MNFHPQLEHAKNRPNVRSYCTAAGLRTTLNVATDNRGIIRRKPSQEGYVTPC